MSFALLTHLTETVIPFKRKSNFKPALDPLPKNWPMGLSDLVRNERRQTLVNQIQQHFEHHGFQTAVNHLTAGEEGSFNGGDAYQGVSYIRPYHTTLGIGINKPIRVSAHPPITKEGEKNFHHIMYSAHAKEVIDHVTDDLMKDRNDMLFQLNQGKTLHEDVFTLFRLLSEKEELEDPQLVFADLPASQQIEGRHLLDTLKKSVTQNSVINQMLPQVLKLIILDQLAKTDPSYEARVNEEKSKLDRYFDAHDEQKRYILSTFKKLFKDYKIKFNLDLLTP